VFEAITHIVGGGFQHEDNLGNDSVVSAVGAKKFNAGSGNIH
jgi:redox-sensitive bicupin YhaK (pirin superfamily)